MQLIVWELKFTLRPAAYQYTQSDALCDHKVHDHAYFFAECMLGGGAGAHAALGVLLVLRGQWRRVPVGMKAGGVHASVKRTRVLVVPMSIQHLASLPSAPKDASRTSLDSRSPASTGM